MMKGERERECERERENMHPKIGEKRDCAAFVNKNVEEEISVEMMIYRRCRTYFSLSENCDCQPRCDGWIDLIRLVQLDEDCHHHRVVGGPGQDNK